MLITIISILELQQLGILKTMLYVKYVNTIARNDVASFFFIGAVCIVHK